MLHFVKGAAQFKNLAIQGNQLMTNLAAITAPDSRKFLDQSSKSLSPSGHVEFRKRYLKMGVSSMGSLFWSCSVIENRTSSNVVPASLRERYSSLLVHTCTKVRASGYEVSDLDSLTPVFRASGQTLLIGAWGNKNWVYLVAKHSQKTKFGQKFVPL